MNNLTGNQIRSAAKYYIEDMEKRCRRPLRFMEVCGTHTVSVFKAGIRQILPPTVELVSGPGCPVCVTPHDYLDQAIAYARQKDVILTTFGDMLRIPASTSNLQNERAAGADIRIVYSPMDSLDIAVENPKKQVIFLAVGFETTAPTAAATILAARQQNLDNFFVLSSHKLVPPALRTLLVSQETVIDGFLLPGHVSAIIGEAPYHFLQAEYGLPAVIAGFEPLDILRALHALTIQILDKKTELINQYTQVVPAEGNLRALEILYQVYQPADVPWRGLGTIPASGLELREEYQNFLATKQLPVKTEPMREFTECRCGEVLRGLIRPPECTLFGKNCTPVQPVGACMVSVEGTCAAWHMYGSGRWQV